MSGKLAKVEQRIRFEAGIINRQWNVKKELGILARQFDHSFLSATRLDAAVASFGNFRVGIASVELPPHYGKDLPARGDIELQPWKLDELEVHYV